MSTATLPTTKRYPISYGSAVINGQLVPVETRAAWAPRAYGASAAVSPVPLLSIPPTIGGDWGAPATISPLSGSQRSGTTAAAVSAPFNLQVSPVVWAVLFLLLGLLGLRFIHWR